MHRLKSLSSMYNVCRMFRYSGKVEFPVHVNKYRVLRYKSTLLHQSQSDESPLEKETSLILRIVREDKSLEDKLGMIVTEVNSLRLRDLRVPSYLIHNEWLELTRLESMRARRKYLEFCWKKRMAKENKLRNRERDKLLTPLSRTVYNKFCLPMSKIAVNHFFNAKLIQAIQYNQEIVIDCGFEKVMTRREIVNCGKQLKDVFASNRSCIEPFNLYFCNAPKENVILQEFVKIVKTAYEPHFPLNIRNESYLDIFPKNKLVYLSPNSPEILERYDHNAIYIIGGLVDRKNSRPWSYERALEQGIKMFKLPLDKYISWASGGGKSLTLDQMMKIMLDMKLTGDWRIAFRHVPKRKIVKMKV